jgi:hypothetical protein
VDAALATISPSRVTSYQPSGIGVSGSSVIFIPLTRSSSRVAAVRKASRMPAD